MALENVALGYYQELLCDIRDFIIAMGKRLLFVSTIILFSLFLEGDSLCT